MLEVRGLGRTGTGQDPSAIVLEDVSFSVRPGEIVGLAGLVGSGRTEIARAIFGADEYDRGEIVVDGQPIRIRSPREAIRLGSDWYRKTASCRRWCSAWPSAKTCLCRSSTG